MSTALPRESLVTALYEKVFSPSNRFVHLGAPAASGKTSLLQLFRRYCSDKGVTCIYVSLLYGNFEAVLKIETGIDVGTWRLEPGGVCDNPHKQFVVMLDDAQHQYGNVGLWASLIKPKPESSLPGNIRFIISATYSLHIEDSPVDFNLLPKLVRSDFLLSRDEVDEFIRESSARMHKERAGTLLVHPGIRNVIAANCNGHIGVLSLSVRAILNHFIHNTTVTVEEIVGFYLSRAMSQLYLRCYSCGVTSLPERMRESLVRCLTEGLHTVAKDENPDAYRRLIRCGVLTEDAGGDAQFTSPAAAGYINDLLFPNRAEIMIADIKRAGIFALMKSVVARMSGTTLRRSVLNSSTDVPSEATFKHLLLAALHAETPASCRICPELSKLFPPSPSHEMDVAQLPAVKGRCDYYLNGDLRWAVEALINGRGAGEHLSRLVDQDKYVGLGYTDYVVIDFRMNDTGEPTHVRQHERRMSVFFKKGDFSFCTVLCGHQKEAERITLAN